MPVYFLVLVHFGYLPTLQVSSAWPALFTLNTVSLPTVAVCMTCSVHNGNGGRRRTPPDRINVFG